ncbi:sperm-associated antigen 8 [Mobula birostris]|uniref:sperm-associated antigen 8 n=1 Tax=Mobula birostris TaxID=1983395 RepID=UPI003B28D7A6
MMDQVVCNEVLATRSPPLRDGNHGQGEQTGERAGRSRTRPGEGGPGMQGNCETREVGRRQGDDEEQVTAEAGDGGALESLKDRIANKCLIGNWQEERNSAPIDQQQAKTTSRALAFKNGHKGLLSIDYLSKMSGISTYKEFYHPPSGPKEQEIGIKKQLFEKYMYHKISKEVYDEYKEAFAIQLMESLSVTGRDFKMEGFKSVPRPPVMRHDYKTEQPITIWSDHVKQVQGVTEIKTGDTPFRKNASFTRPIMEALDT